MLISALRYRTIGIIEAKQNYSTSCAHRPFSSSNVEENPHLFFQNLKPSHRYFRSFPSRLVSGRYLTSAQRLVRHESPKVFRFLVSSRQPKPHAPRSPRSWLPALPPVAYHRPGDDPCVKMSGGLTDVLFPWRYLQRHITY